MRKQSIVALINRVGKYWVGTCGNCGVFALALNKMLGNEGQLFAYVAYDEYDMDIVGFTHVLLEYNGYLYDCEGVRTIKGVEDDYNPYDNDDENYGGYVHEFQYISDVFGCVDDEEMEQIIYQNTSNYSRLDTAIKLFEREYEKMKARKKSISNKIPDVYIDLS